MENFGNAIRTLDPSNDHVTHVGVLPKEYKGDPAKDDDGIGFLTYLRVNDKYFAQYQILSQPWPTIISVGETILQAEGNTYEEAEAKLLAILNSFEVTVE